MRAGGARQPGAYPILMDAASGRPGAAGLRPLLPLGFESSPPSRSLSPGRVMGFAGPAGASATVALTGCGAGLEQLPPGPPGPAHRPSRTQPGAKCGRMSVGLGPSARGGHRATGRARGGGPGAAPAPLWAPRALGGASVVQGALGGAQVLSPFLQDFLEPLTCQRGFLRQVLDCFPNRLCLREKGRKSNDKVRTIKQCP